MNFTKMNGAGNDFVITDNRITKTNFTPKTIAKLCNRNRGIGADGFMSVESPENDGDYRMRYYNADGNEAEMCGNGARCFARFVFNNVNRDNVSMKIETIAGIITAEIKEDLVEIQLSEPFDLRLNETIALNNSNENVHSINTGVPHAVVFSERVHEINLKEIGFHIRNHPLFEPDGTNVNYVQIDDDNLLTIRTYERGVEDETLACGTGMVATALIHHQLNEIEPPVKVNVQGGDTLMVSWKYDDGQYSNVTLTGPALSVFKGEINV